MPPKLPNLDRLLALLEEYLAPSESGALSGGLATEEEIAAAEKDSPVKGEAVPPGPWPLPPLPSPSEVRLHRRRRRRLRSFPGRFFGHLFLGVGSMCSPANSRLPCSMKLPSLADLPCTLFLTPLHDPISRDQYWEARGKGRLAISCLLTLVLQLFGSISSLRLIVP